MKVEVNRDTAKAFVPSIAARPSRVAHAELNKDKSNRMLPRVNANKLLNPLSPMVTGRGLIAY